MVGPSQFVSVCFLSFMTDIQLLCSSFHLNARWITPRLFIVLELSPDLLALSARIVWHEKSKYSRSRFSGIRLSRNFVEVKLFMKKGTQSLSVPIVELPLKWNVRISGIFLALHLIGFDSIRYIKFTRAHGRYETSQTGGHQCTESKHSLLNFACC